MNTIFRYLSGSVPCQTVRKDPRPPRGNGSDRPDAGEYQRGGSDAAAAAGSFLDSTGEGCEHFQPIPHGITGEHQKSGYSGVWLSRVPLLSGAEYGKKSPVSAPISAGAAVFGVLASSAARFVWVMQREHQTREHQRSITKQGAGGFRSPSPVVALVSAR